ncbi:YraN family protein [candidate division KSB1 bacterium]|nr:YraN family protein [candidate division KSB1 bacterium]
MKSKQLGKLGEELAARFLAHSGMQVLQRNFRIREGEIDIVALDKQVLVFIEVKTCRSDAFGEPETWVTLRKQKRIGRAAMAYLQKHDKKDQDCRFDVVTVHMNRDKPEIHHIVDAFWLPEGIW